MLPLITLRLQNQLLVQPPFDAPQQVVEWMGAVQAQDYRMAKWAVGCRTASTDATQIEAALNRGDILRTHLLRPTWHFVSSKDLRWMLSLTADRIRAANDWTSKEVKHGNRRIKIHNRRLWKHPAGFCIRPGYGLSLFHAGTARLVARFGR